MVNRDLSVVYVTRPIQYLNATNIPNMGYNCILLLENSFNGFEKVKTIAENDRRWKQIVQVNSFKEVIRWLLRHQFSISTFYTFTDNGLSWQIAFNLLLDVEICLYEEGAATYMPRELSGFKKGLYSIANFGQIANRVYLGYNKNIKKIYVYDTILHKKSIGCTKEVVPFERPFFELAKSRALAPFHYPDCTKFHAKKILLYITSWDYNEDIIPLLNQYENYYKVLKPHPHFEGKNETANIFDDVIDSTYLAEFLISDMLAECQELIIIHQCSTCILHLDNLQNVKIINLVSKYTDFSSYNRLMSLKES